MLGGCAPDDDTDTVPPTTEPAATTTTVRTPPVRIEQLAQYAQPFDTEFTLGDLRVTVTAPAPPTVDPARYNTLTYTIDVHVENGVNQARLRPTFNLLCSNTPEDGATWADSTLFARETLLEPAESTDFDVIISQPRGAANDPIPCDDPTLVIHHQADLRSVQHTAALALPN
jgi:hypothetical protein